MGKKYLMSSAQKRLFVIDQMQEANITYNIPIIMQSDRSLDLERLQKAVALLCGKHEILRTRFEAINGKMLQIVEEDIVPVIEVFNMKHKTTEQIIDEFIRPFNLSQLPLFRVGFIKNGANDGMGDMLLIDIHHIIYDGGSMMTFFDHLAKAYNQEMIPVPKLQYKDFSAWQNKMDISKQREYWLTELAGELPQVELPLDYPRPKTQSFHGAVRLAGLAAGIPEQITAFCQQHKLTEYIFFLTAYMILLSKYSQSQEVIVGTPVTGRTHPDVQDMIGMFVNTLAMKGELNPGSSAEECMELMKGRFLEAYENQDYPFEQLIEDLKLPPDPSRNPGFDTMFVYQHGGSSEFLLGDARLTEFPLPIKVSKFDVTLTINKSEDDYTLNWEYNCDLFKESTIDRINQHFQAVLLQILTNSKTAISDLRYLGRDEYDRIISEFQGKSRAYDREMTMIRLFEQQAEQHPERIALQIGTAAMSYRTVNAKANALGLKLRGWGIGVNDIVGILMERSMEMVIAMLGVLKAGAVYLPMNPKNPVDRINYMLSDSGASIVLSQPALVEKNQLQTKAVAVGQLAEIPDNPEPAAAANDLAYIIYTSGTTGNPKGVMVEHQSMINLMSWLIPYSELDQYSVVLQKASCAFDASAFEIYMALLSGSALQLLTEEENDDFDKLTDLLIRKKVTHTTFIPTFFTALLDYLKDSNKNQALSGVKKIYLAGEMLTVDMLHKYREITGESWSKINNLYGPTESTICASGYQLAETEDSPVIPIGRPINNTEIFILDGISLCGIGIPGELCIGGDSLARGYLNRPQLTAEKFIQNPLKPEERLYRTGDLARWREDGMIECLGRIDDQVKIRGFRIELEEIKNKLVGLPDMKDAAVLAVNHNGDKKLCAYFVAETSQKTGEIAALLEQSLPDYMVPSCLIQVDYLPVTMNGKLDKRALPAPDFTRSENYEPPQNEQEGVLAELFQTVLAAERVGVHDNFFEFGGHSLKAMQLISLIEKNMNWKVSLKQFMELKTVRKIAAYYSQIEKNSYEPITKTEYQQMSSAQKRIYAVTQADPDSTAYNMPFGLTISGDFEIKKLETVLIKLIERHHILRTSFKANQDQFYQTVEPSFAFDLEYEAIDEAAVENCVKAFIRPFDLSKAPLVRAKLFKIAESPPPCGQRTEKEQSHLLMMDFHHIVFDGGSVGVLFREMVDLYNGTELTPLKIQYSDYSAWHHNLDMEAPKEYWLNELAGVIPGIDLPKDIITALPGHEKTAGRIHLKTGNHSTEALKAFCVRHNVTDYMVLMSAFLILLSRYSRQDELVLGTPVSGRTHPDTQDMIGMFVNTIVVRADIDKEQQYLEFLATLKEKILTGLDYQNYPFEKIIEQLGITRQGDENPLFNVMFSVDGGGDLAFRLGGAAVEQYPVKPSAAKFDLSLSVSVGTECHYIWEYHTKLFKADSIERMAGQLMVLVEDILNESEKQIKHLTNLSPAEYQHVVFDFNQTSFPYPDQSSITEIFKEQVRLMPEHRAVGMAGRVLNYRELDRITDYYAARLCRLGAVNGQFVGVATIRAVETIVGIISIIKAGAAYLPLNPDSPESEINFILQDSNCGIILSGRPLTWQLDGSISEILIALDETGGAVTDLPPQRPDDTAYLMYTSGTTGKPKGVMVSHRNIIKLVKDCDFADFTNVSVLQTGALTFDAATLELWGALLNGGYVFLADKDILLEIEKLRTVIIAQEINWMCLTPLLFNQLVSDTPSLFDQIGYLILGGEKISEPHVKLLRNHNPGIRIVNGYGPTENTTASLAYEVGPEVPDLIPIGKPISNTTAYIFDGEQLCGIGIPGELCVGGDGVAKGYLGRDELTEKVFIDDPFSAAGRLYRTGDLARVRADGNFEFLGRIDHQVKIRGFRIELDGIKQQIGTIDGVSDVCVVIKEKNNNKLICAYIIPAKQLVPDEIRSQLENRLPNYMIPNSIMMVEQFPMTRNGKIDFNRLPEPEISSQKIYTAPRNQQEQAVANVFTEILGVAQAGIDDNFFELGGDSIKAIRIVSKLRELGWEITVKEILQGKTLKKIGSLLNKSVQSSADQGMVTGEVKLTPIQSQFLQSHLKRPNHFNQSMILEYDGAIEEKLLVDSLDELVRHHDMLRAVYAGGSQIIQPYQPAGHYHFSVYDLRMADENELRRQVLECGAFHQSTLCIERGPLISVVLFKTGEKDLVLVIVHHLVIDGISWRILLEDLNAVYKALKNSQAVILPAKTASFMQWSDYLDEYSKSAVIRAEFPYWQKIQERVEQSELSFTVPEFKNEELCSSFELSEAETQQLIRRTGILADSGMDELLLAGLVRAVSKVCDNQWISVCAERHGRESSDKSPDIDRTAGWFTSIYPLVFKQMCSSAEDTFHHVRETLAAVPNHGIGYGLLHTYGEMQLTSWPEITFNYLGEFDSENKKHGGFYMINMEHGEDIDPENEFGTPLSVNAIMIEGQMRVMIGYDQSRYPIGFIHRLTESLKQSYQELIKLGQKRQPFETDRQPLVAWLWNRYKIEARVETILLQEKQYHLLFIDEKNQVFMSEVMEAMKYHLSKETLPDYLLTIRQYREDLYFSTITELHQFVAAARLYQSAELPEAVLYLDQAEAAFYPAMGIQSSYLTAGMGGFIRYQIEVSGSFKKSELVRAIGRIIEEQAAFRSSWRLEDGKLIISEHLLKAEYSVPYFDLVYLPETVRVKRIAEAFRQEKIGQNQLLSQIVITKETERLHLIHINISHAVWDKASAIAMEELLNDYLNYQDRKPGNVESPSPCEWRTEVVSNKPYADLLAASNCAWMADQTGRDNCQIPRFLDCARAFIQKVNSADGSGKSPSLWSADGSGKSPSLWSADGIRQEIAVIDLGDRLMKQFKEHTWEMLEYFLRVIALENHFIENNRQSLPVLLLQENRSYMPEEYQDAIGCYLDCLPVLIPPQTEILQSEIGKRIQLLQKEKKEKKINFVDLLLTLDPGIRIDRLLSVNYQGSFDLSYQQVREMETQVQEHQAEGLEVVVNTYLNHLILIYPVKVANGQVKQALSESLEKIICLTKDVMK